MNAPLSMGNLIGDVITCPFHGAKFTVAPGKNIAEPVFDTFTRNGTITKDVAKSHGTYWGADVPYKEVQLTYT